MTTDFVLGNFIGKSFKTKRQCHCSKLREHYL